MIHRIEIHTGNANSQVVIGESYRNLVQYVPGNRQIIIITDTNILQHYGRFINSYPVIEIGTGEKNKNIKTLEHIYGRLMDCDADRNSFIVGIGGGIVCDVAGFAASTFMRGVSFGFVSTTLLSQVDASVGGKNGINFGGYKNMAGTFNQPCFVICDTEMIRTLPGNELVSGFAEIVKAAAIRDACLFAYLEKYAGLAAARDPEVIRRLVVGAVKIKAQVVECDEREHGERRILNFGHTFGHAIEVQAGISHGEAVSIGMMIAARWSVQECGFPESQARRLERLLSGLGLPVRTNIKPADILQCLMKDKKRESNYIHLVLLNDIGKTEIHKTPISKIEDMLHRYM